MSFSDEFKINVNKLNADEMLLVLLEINHSSLSSPIRLVNDNQDFLSNSNNYMAMPFRLNRQEDVKNELPKVILSLPNPGRSLVRWIDSTNGGTKTNIKIMLARRSTPDLIEETLNLGIDKINITTEFINLSLIVQNNLIKRAVRYTYDTKRAPGLF